MKATELNIAVKVLRVRLLETGVWCEPCALPSAVRIEVLFGGGLGQGYVHGRYCHDCGGHEVDR